MDESARHPRGGIYFEDFVVGTLVRHRLPVAIVCGNNGIWGLEKHPMQAMYGYDVAADLQPGLRYDEVVRALAPDGVFTTFAYIHALWTPPARRLRRALHERFEEVVPSATVWANLPPALVYYCRRPRGLL